MSVKRETQDAAVVPTIAEGPRQFVERTPILGLTPTLPDDEVIDLAVAARRAAQRAFGAVDSALVAETPASV